MDFGKSAKKKSLADFHFAAADIAADRGWPEAAFLRMYFVAA
jgi:hypothetical protein